MEGEFSTYGYKKYLRILFHTPERNPPLETQKFLWGKNIKQIGCGLGWMYPRQEQVLKFGVR